MNNSNSKEIFIAFQYIKKSTIIKILTINYRDNKAITFEEKYSIFIEVLFLTPIENRVEIGLYIVIN